jgi:hypothetical protein
LDQLQEGLSLLREFWAYHLGRKLAFLTKRQRLLVV